MWMWTIFFGLMKIIPWNVNSVRARITNIKDYIKQSSPDILFLQEIKTQNKTFPYEVFKNLGYESYVFGQKSYNGVAIISKQELDKISNSFIKDDLKQSRILTAELKLKNKKIELINIYVPNGNPINSEKLEYKLSWIEAFIEHTKSLLEFEMPVILAGDYNIIPEEIDCWDEQVWKNDALAIPDIRFKFREIKNLGYFDSFRLINKNKCEGMVNIRNFPKGYFLYNESNYSFEDEQQKLIFQLGDSVFIEVINADIIKRHIDFKLIGHS